MLSITITFVFIYCVCATFMLSYLQLSYLQSGCVLSKLPTIKLLSNYSIHLFILILNTTVTTSLIKPDNAIHSSVGLAPQSILQLLYYTITISFVVRYYNFNLCMWLPSLPVNTLIIIIIIILSSTLSTCNYCRMAITDNYGHPIPYQTPVITHTCI